MLESIWSNIQNNIYIFVESGGNNKTNVQLCQMNIIPLLSKPDINEVILNEQKLPLKCCQPLDFLYTSLKDLDLLTM